MQKSIETQEKNSAAASSVVAAVFLTGVKLVVGLLTGSLGILSEAAHSGLDLVAALVTFFAVRASGRPADSVHQYGHGKVENLSALVETLLLLITSVWIIYEAIRRIFFTHVAVEVNAWSFAVMAASIIVDLTRSRILMRAAKKYNSQALEADALHFSTDIWSSSVVIGGLLLVWLQRHFALSGWLSRADAVAALGVACIVIWVSYQLGLRTVAALLDTAPPGLKERILAEVSGMEGVLAVEQVRVRESGPGMFVDIDIAADRSMSLSRGHEIADNVEKRIQEIVPRSDVMVHVDPAAHAAENTYEKIRGVAATHGLAIHSVHVHDIRGEVYIELHVEVPEELTLQQAHHLVSAMEYSLLEEVPRVADVVTHIEPASRHPTPKSLSRREVVRLEEQIRSVADGICGAGRSHKILVRSEAGQLSIALHCELAPDVPIGEAHEKSEDLEIALRRSIPNVGQVVVHLEPLE
jgi:cation diffusion facilitator family transporter